MGVPLAMSRLYFLIDFHLTQDASYLSRKGNPATINSTEDA
jgi:hypothetical protein